MAAISIGVQYKLRSVVCDGDTLCMQRFGGNGSTRPSLAISSYPNYSQNQKIGCAKKAINSKFDFFGKGLQLRLWIPLFKTSAERKWVEEECDKSVGQSARKSGDDLRGNEEEISVKRRSKFVAVNFSEEKAKLLRKSLRSASSYHEGMYHSAIASRLASPDSSSDELNG